MAAFINKYVKQILTDWREDRISLATAAQRLVSAGWSVKNAYAFLARY